MAKPKTAPRSAKKASSTASKPTTKTPPSKTPAAAKKPAAPTPSPPAESTALQEMPKSFTLNDVLALAKGADPRLRATHFARVSDESLLSKGQKIDTQNILDDLPRFFWDVRAIYGGLPAARRRVVVGYTPRLDAVLAAEAGVLYGLHVRHRDGSQSGKVSRAKAKADAAAAWTAGIALRDQAAGTMARLLGDAASDLEEVRAKKGTADTADDLRRGLEGLADLIATHRKADAALRATMDEEFLDATYIQELRDAAARVKQTDAAAAAASPEARVTQRQLDLQDGAVLHLVNVIYRAFRDAHDRDETILLPRLGSMAPLIDRVRPSTKPVAAPAPTTKNTTP